jgi:hypothetical protein
LKVDCFVDADFAGLWPHEDHDDPVCVKSRSGYVILFIGLSSRGSKLQGEISMSIMEAEYNALRMSMRELLPFKHLVEAVATMVGYEKSDMTTFKTTVWEDNMGALTLGRMVIQWTLQLGLFLPAELLLHVSIGPSSWNVHL